MYLKKALKLISRIIFFGFVAFVVFLILFFLFNIYATSIENEKAEAVDLLENYLSKNKINLNYTDFGEPRIYSRPWFYSLLHDRTFDFSKVLAPNKLFPK